MPPRPQGSYREYVRAGAAASTPASNATSSTTPVAATADAGGDATHASDAGRAGVIDADGGGDAVDAGAPTSPSEGSTRTRRTVMAQVT